MHKSAQETLTIAFASSDPCLVDAHFGSCPSLVIYSVTQAASKHIKTVALPHYEGHHPQKITDRLNALTDCFAVYCLACGNPVRQQLLAQGTRVVISAQEAPIANLINDMQSNWPGEIARRQARQISRKKESDYFDKLADGAWDE
ncbi:MAG: nitrogen fixation protein NifX [Psychromonas sp.]|jgi:nitrogen fixation protein NifX|uniref:NifB/NifX family molybdenum-iron cluster-binding protein n=1 Tax=Psychromonas sp. TaxID=1884585 RepID=UPI0039E3D89F